MDAFYASIEQRDFPEKYAGEPIAVGGTPPRGVVQTASYEARPHGVHSAQPAAEANRLCPDLIFVSPRMNVYKEESKAIRKILYRYTELVEPLSLDEAYLDVTSREPSQSRFGDCSFKRTRVDETARWPYGTKLRGAGCGVRNLSQERGDGSSART
jgi:DNA polymerase-4